MSADKRPSGITVLFVNGHWQHYPEAEDLTIFEDEGTIVLYGVDGAEVESFYGFVAIAATYVDFIKEPPADFPPGM
jgi:hypothetical protein